MPVSIGIISYRLPSLTLEEFRERYETKLVPMITSLTDRDAAPITYRRHYLNRTSDGKPALIHGDADRADWDCFVEVTFRDEEHLQKYLAAHEANIEAIRAYEATFIDRTKVLVETYETEGV